MTRVQKKFELDFEVYKDKAKQKNLVSSSSLSAAWQTFCPEGTFSNFKNSEIVIKRFWVEIKTQ